MFIIKGWKIHDKEINTIKIIDEENTMPTFAVKRNLPGISMEELGQAQKLAIETSEQLTEQGMPVKYIRSNFFPEDSTCTCLFESDAARIVEKVNVDAGIPFEEIVEVVDIPHP